MAYDGFAVGLIQLSSTSVGASSLTFMGLPNSPCVFNEQRRDPSCPRSTPEGFQFLQVASVQHWTGKTNTLRLPRL